jgi:hypothetical protein
MTTLINFFALALVAMTVQCNMGDYNNINGTGEVNQEEFDLKNFDQVSFSNGWDVEIIQSNQNKLVAKANQNLLDELEVENNDGYLKVGTNSGDNIGKADEKSITLYFNSDLKTLKASSGVSLTSGDQLEFNDIVIASSSGSDVDLDIKTKKLDCSSSSGSNLYLKISSTDVEASSSSGSKLELSGKSDALNAKSSSGSSLKLIGYSESLTANSSSGSKIDAKDQKSVNVTADASSGSRIDVYPMETLNGSASSGASIKYHNEPSVKLTKDESSGGNVSSK